MDRFDDYANGEERYKEVLNNEIVMPEYNKFLEKHGIDFSILADKSQDITDPLYARFKFHEKCLNVFNKARKHFHFHREKIVAFHFTTLIDFRFDEWTIEEFLKDAGEIIDEIEILESKLKIFKYISVVFALISAITIPILIAQYFIPKKYSMISLIILLTVGFYLAGYSEIFLSKYFRERKNKSIKREMRKIKLEMGKSV